MKLLTPILVIFISVALYFMNIVPLSDDVKALVRTKGLRTNVLLKAQELNSKRGTVADAYASISDSDKDKLNKIIPQKFDSVMFANDLNGIALKNNLSFQDFKVDETGGGDQVTVVEQNSTLPYKTTTTSFVVIGQYFDFVKFMDTVDKSLRLMDVVGLSVEPSVKQEKKDSGLLQFTLIVKTYSLK